MGGGLSVNSGLNMAMRRTLWVIALFCFLAGGDSLIAEDPSMLSRLTTLIQVQFAAPPESLGTGFFFQVLAPPKDPQKRGPQWRAIEGLYVITNRHVIAPQRFATLRKLTFFLRRSNPTTVDWHGIELSAEELGRRLHLHPNPQVDVAAIDVLDLVTAEFKKPAGTNTSSVLQPWSAVSRDNFPGVSRLQISAGEDAIVIGYPRLFYDEFNKLPILKPGMVITPWGLKYNNLDAFLIDYKFFHGSSGSIVVSRPTDLLIEKGTLMTYDTKQLLFLGVYAGEPFKPGELKETDEAIIREKVRVDVGLVWYYYTVEQAVQAPVFRP